MTAAPVCAGVLAAVAAHIAISSGGFTGSSFNRAWAAPGSRPPTMVVLFTPPTADPLVARIEAELAAVHIAVRILDVPPDSEIDAVVTSEISSGASAAIRVLPHSSGTEVWTSDTTAQVLRRRSISGADTSDAATAVVALRTVEFLRASLLNLGHRPSQGSAAPRSGTDPTTSAPTPAAPTGTAPAAPNAPVPAPSPTRTAIDRTPRNRDVENRSTAGRADSDSENRARIAEPSVERTTEDKTPGSETVPPAKPFAIAFGPALMASRGGIPSITSASVIGQVEITERAGVEVMALFPLAPARLNNAQGSSQISVALFGAAGSFRLSPPGPWITDASVGVSAVMLRAVGDPSVQVNSSSATTWAFAAQARLGGGLAITPWLAVRVDVIGGATARHILIAYVSEPANISHDVAAWGRAFAAATAGLQASW